MGLSEEQKRESAEQVARIKTKVANHIDQIRRMISEVSDDSRMHVLREAAGLPVPERLRAEFRAVEMGLAGLVVVWEQAAQTGREIMEFRRGLPFPRSVSDASDKMDGAASGHALLAYEKDGFWGDEADAPPVPAQERAGQVPFLDLLRLEDAGFLRLHFTDGGIGIEFPKEA